MGNKLEEWGLTLPLQQGGATEEWSALRWFDLLSEVREGEVKHA